MVKIIVFGLNHKSASVDCREKVAFAPETMVEQLRDAVNKLALDEVVILSTCNRTEIYSAGKVSDDAIVGWLSSARKIQPTEIEDHYYCYRGLEAQRQLIKVASGMDSLILGEPQIFGQIKSAYAVALEAGTVSAQLNQSFQHAFATAKRVRTETAIGQNPVSVAYASVILAEQIFSRLESLSVLLIGAGETIELVAKHLKQKNVGYISVANRTLSRAKKVVGHYASEAILLSDIPDRLHLADIVISSTASQLPILGKGAVESALKKRRNKPMFLVDIAVPRDIEPEVESLPDIYLYTVDDLKGVIKENIRARESAADIANDIVEQELDSWVRLKRESSVVDTIRAFRTSVENIRDIEVEKAFSAIERGHGAKEVIDTLARNLTNKLMHKPTARLKLAGEEGRDDTIHATHELFGLKDTK